MFCDVNTGAILRWKLFSIREHTKNQCAQGRGRGNRPAPTSRQTTGPWSSEKRDIDDHELMTVVKETQSCQGLDSHWGLRELLGTSRSW